MFQDEARFGRIQEPYRCWARKNSRPLVGQQLVREYTYAYGAVSPKDGKSDFLILPTMNHNCFENFLEELSSRYPNEYILMFCDGASAHSAKVVPDNIQLCKLPPYSPELNPVENIWDDMREKWFKNKTFKSMDAVISQLTNACVFYENSPEICQSITAFTWIDL
jgi:transposase